ncbi:MAG TPA: M1 family metallopeptidase [Cyclobacteriaceae bacterium]|nr:M1 family metallopeptidase [Cyclobacteriaceae bacterium]
MKALLTALMLFVLKTVQATDPYPRNEDIDVRHYAFTLSLNDTTNVVSGSAAIEISFKKPVSAFELDLVNVNSSGQGMKVLSVTVDHRPLSFTHGKDRLKIFIDATAGQEKVFVITYTGIPQDGLIISKNKFGDRTFFGDNWPNRAHHWLPTIDHPYDKATCEFIITAPEHYSVVATGEKIEESAVAKNQKLTHWKTSVIVPTKVMVIGVARFAVRYEGRVDDVPLESWVYPQNRVEGFSDYAIAAGPLAYFSSLVGRYPFEKLANVQSTTRYGGMENAGNIFYYENSVTGKGNIEVLVAHEIAHQWFGDSASEADWFHVWLSEGFSTYLAHAWSEKKYGEEKLAEEMKADRLQVISFFTKNPSPVVNTALTDINKVLNTNSYQKGSWVLHMLRQELGDQKFWEGIRQYYRKYQLGNALTDDFREVMETISGRDLKAFFEQWIYRAGHPRIEVVWTYNATIRQLKLVVEQKQEKLFDFTLEIGVGASSAQKFRISSKKQEFQLSSPEKPEKIELDPRVTLLFEGTIRPGK